MEDRGIVVRFRAESKFFPLRNFETNVVVGGDYFLTCKLSTFTWNKTAGA